MKDLTLIFVHGYSVTNLDTYGGLPARLQLEAAARGVSVRIENIYLGRFISFNDEVVLNDISRALEVAIRQQVVLKKDERFICITHSTGGPLVRNWLRLFYDDNKNNCPLSHLIMLAPANFGSTLAQLGKTRLSRVKSWFDGVEPGQGILNWLELGSNEAWDLNEHWIKNGSSNPDTKTPFLFVLIGQDIDRKLYDHINAYTGEPGSDGVMRVAAANLNANYLRLVQNGPTNAQMEVEEFAQSQPTAFRIIRNKSHSGNSMGIMRSVLPTLADAGSAETIDTIFACIDVKNEVEYEELRQKLQADNMAVQNEGLVETELRAGFKKYYLHERYSQVIFRVRDSEGRAVTNFDLVLTGKNNDPDGLPPGFFADRQCNRINHNTLTYYINYNVMIGRPAIKNSEGEIISPLAPGINELGISVYPRPDEGFVRYVPAHISANKDLFEKVLKPNSCTMVEIVLKRLVSTEVFRFEKTPPNDIPDLSFKNAKPGDGVV